MKLDKLWIAAILNIIFLASSFILAKEVVDKGQAYDSLMHEHVKILGFKDRLLNQDEWVLLISGKVITSVKDTVWLEKKKTSELKLRAAQENYEQALEMSKFIWYAAAGLLLLTIFIYAGGKKLFHAIGASFTSMSLVFLYIGVFAPLLQIHAYDEDLKVPIVIKFDEMAAWADKKINDSANWLEDLSSDYLGYDFDIPEYNALSFLIDGYQYDHSVVFEGRTYYYFQSKSIDSIIRLLYKDNNRLIANIILAFSVIIPLFKLLFTILLLYWEKARKNKTITIILTLIGKWSMADVFVTGVFVAYFSFHSMHMGQIETESSVLLGFYFFLSYAIISILASIMLWIAAGKEMQLKLYEAV
ncbi:paraquat-inducible protein A [Parvicella tangerina]|nr:paraquat-inducible protein A [Parvicella tangerina]